jgi:tRNA (guanine26-N2/guanine27-N2)-dimethyltransferase
MGLGIEPVFSLFFGESYRVMVRLVSPSALSSANYGFLGYCHSCGDYQIVSWQGLGRVCCAQDGKPLTISGPMWLGKLHDREQLAKMALLAEEWGWSKRVELLREMEAEADFPPYFYTLREIGKRGRMNTPKRDNLLQALQEQGYHASSTHINPQAIKTDANLATCIHISDRLNKSLSPWRF